MASKKFLFLTGMFCLLTSYVFSQRVGASYDVKDSSVIPSKRMKQQTESGDEHQPIGAQLLEIQRSEPGSDERTQGGADADDREEAPSAVGGEQVVGKRPEL